MKGMRLADGRERVVRHGHGPERLVQTGIGLVAVLRVTLRERGADGRDSAIWSARSATFSGTLNL